MWIENGAHEGDCLSAVHDVMSTESVGCSATDARFRSIKCKYHDKNGILLKFLPSFPGLVNPYSIICQILGP